MWVVNPGQLCHVGDGVLSRHAITIPDKVNLCLEEAYVSEWPVALVARGLCVSTAAWAE